MDFSIFEKDVSGFIGDIYFKYFFTDKKKPLVITFALHGGPEKKQAESGIDPWGFSSIKKRGLNILSFSCTKENINYYRDKVFIENVKKIGEYLPDFIERVGYGSSMGGYGVSAYADALRISRILLLDPISSRKKDIATWDFENNRSLKTFEYDWDGDYADGSQTNATGYVVYDPLYQLDKMHAIRYVNLTKLKVPGVGHYMPIHLQKMKILSWLVDSFIKNDLDEIKFNEKSRKRRNIEGYYSWMTSSQNKHLTCLRKKVISLYHRDIVLGIHLNKEGYDKYIGFTSISKDDIDEMRDTALKIERIDIRLAYDLMSLALKLRPNGPFIKKKVEEYKKILPIDNTKSAS